MSTETQAKHEQEAVEHEYATHHEKLFVMTALGLSLLTAIEVAWSYLPWPENHGIGVTIAEDGGLLAMMMFKFYVVASVFMHLKWDSKLLTGVFYFGLILAAVVYIVVLMTFHVFGGDGLPYTPFHT